MAMANVDTVTLNEALVKVATANKNYTDTNFQKKSDDSLLTNNKTIIGAINELFETNTAVADKEVLDKISSDLDTVKLEMANIVNNVSNVQNDITNLSEQVTTIHEIIGTNESGSNSLISRVDALEEVINGDGENSINARIDLKINEFATKISDDGVINTFKEVIDYISNNSNGNGDGNVVDLSGIISDINDLRELVGTTPVNEQITNAIANIKVPVSSNDENKVAILEDGTMEVTSLDVNRLTQSEGEWLVMSGGDAEVDSMSD